MAQLQKALVGLGYPIPNSVSNFYGKETKSAVWDFQIDQRIEDDGTHFGPRTRMALNRALKAEQSLGSWVVDFIQSLLSSV